MHWEQAKNYMIVFFIVLNLALGFMLFWENRQYTLTGSQDRLMRTVLNQNGISMYTIPVQRFAPMRTLGLSGFYYDTAMLKSILFQDPYSVTQTVEFGADVFRDGNSYMTISNGFVFFESPNGFWRNGTQNGGVDMNSASQLTGQFITEHFPTFAADSHTQVQNGVRRIYRERYNGVTVHSNFIEFLVTEVGIFQIEMQFGEVHGHVGTPAPLFSPDEALLIFAQRVRHLTQDAPMTIMSMDIIYFQEIGHFSGNEYNRADMYYAVPFYRIFTCRGDRPFLINALTNAIID